MGVKIFRDGNWNRIKEGAVFRRDIMGLDPEKDRRLFEYLILHMPEPMRRSVTEKLRMEELPEETANIDDPDDELWNTYFVLQEQVQREDDFETLKEAAFKDRQDSLSRFAFCRLTGYSWPPDACDAYSYRTYSCGRKSGVTQEGIEALCREMIEKKGPFAPEAEELLKRPGTEGA